MFKNFVFAAFLLLVTGVAMAAGPAQQWRWEFTGAEEGVLEVAEIEIRAAPGGESVMELFRNYTHEVTDPAGMSTWSIPHDLGVQRKTVSVAVIAYDVDVVAPGAYFYNTISKKLSVRDIYAYTEVDFLSGTIGTTGNEPPTPDIAEVFYNTDTAEFTQWNGSAWTPLTVEVDSVFYDATGDEFHKWDGATINLFAVTQTSSALPVPNQIEPDTTTIVPGAGLPATGGPGANNTVELVFPENVIGGATIRGASFDTPVTNRPGVAVPVIVGLEKRASAAAFDGNKGSWFKSKRAPTFRNPLTLQYSYWVGDPDRYPNVVEYAITAKSAEGAPKSWTFSMYKEGQWIQLDQQAAMRFEDGETRVFTVTGF